MRASEYPIPDYACYVWHRGDGLAFAFPDGGTLIVPLEKLMPLGECTSCGGVTSNIPGWKWLLHTLMRRRMAYEERKAAPSIGDEARPTAQMLEEALKRSYARAHVRTTDKVDVDLFAEGD